MNTKSQIEQLEASLINSPLPSVTCKAYIAPQLMVDFPSQIDDLEPVRVHILLENDEGFPVTISAMNACSALTWRVIDQNIIIENSRICDEQYDPVHMFLGAKEKRPTSRVIELEKRKYKTGKYKFQAWFYGVPLECTFHVTKIDFTTLSMDFQAASAAKELVDLIKP